MVAFEQGQGVAERFALGLQNEVDDGGSAAKQGRPGAGFVVVARKSAHKRHVQMHVRVDAARHHEQSFCVDNLGTGCVQVVPDRFYMFAFNEDICAVQIGGGYYGSVLNEEGHGRWVN